MKRIRVRSLERGPGLSGWRCGRLVVEDAHVIGASPVIAILDTILV